MRIGPENWHWVSIDSIGVPTGGRYGHPEQVAREIEPLGYHLAWSQLFHAFVLYSVGTDHRIRCEWTFYNAKDLIPIPVLPEWITILQHMKEHAAGENVTDFLLKLEADVKYQQACDEEAETQAMANDVMQATELDLGRTPTVTVMVPGRVG